MIDIIAEIDAEITRLQQARALIAGNVAAPRGRGRAARKKHRLSPEGRARIAAAAKARWAAKRKTSK